MYILGISCFYHDSSAALIKDGMVVAAAQEERFSRKKHDTSFPVQSINFCLESQNITIDQIDFVGFYEKPFLKLERIIHQHLEMFPKSLKTFIGSMPAWFTEKLRVVSVIRKKLKYKGKIIFIEHHLAHAASSYLISPFKEAAIVTCDGVGEWTTTSIGKGDGVKLDLLKEIRFPHSLGLLYSTITAYLGFSVNNSEYKVMGLSPYGEMSPEKNEYYKKLLKVIDIKKDGSYKLNLDYFSFPYSNRMPSKKLCELLGGPIKKPNEDIDKRYQDIAAALQLITEEVLTKILNYAQDLTGSGNLVMAGGVALNSVFNGKIIKRTKFKSFWIQPDPGDGGTSIGVAFYIYNSILGNGRVETFKSPYLGPSFSNEEIKSFLKSNGIKHREFKSDNDLVEKTADLIFENKVVGWFQLGMEWGPRALGARSILSNPTNPDMVDILNTKVKHREKFRPFAPAVCWEDANKYFEIDNLMSESANYMLLVYPIKKEWRDKIPAVTHIDGSGRLQTIRRNQNKLYYDLIKRFGKLSGIPILINTSFNIRGEPIVCNYFDAYKCMMGTGIDYLVMGKYLITREDNPQHMWDSEKYAID